MTRGHSTKQVQVQHQSTVPWTTCAAPSYLLAARYDRFRMQL